MRVLKYILALVFGAGLIAAASNTSATAREAIASVTAETDLLIQVLKDWDGDTLHALAISTQSEVLLNATRDATEKIATSSPRIGNRAALKLKAPLKRLVRKVKESVGLIREMKPKFVDAMLELLVLEDLKNQKAASSDLNAAIMGKLKTRVARARGRRSGKKVNRIFNRAIKVYEAK